MKDKAAGYDSPDMGPTDPQLAEAVEKFIAEQAAKGFDPVLLRKAMDETFRGIEPGNAWAHRAVKRYFELEANDHD